MKVVFKQLTTLEEIIAGCLSNKREAQKRLYELFSGKMFAVCLRYSSSTEEAEDFLQEGFIAVFNKIASYRSEGSFEGWIRKIMVNTALQYHRNNKLNFDRLADNDEHATAGFDTSISENYNTKHILDQIQLLPPGYKLVFNLFAIEGYSHKEIAAMLEISEGTSKSQYARARSFLMQRLESDYYKKQKSVFNR